MQVLSLLAYSGVLSVVWAVVSDLLAWTEVYFCVIISTIRVTIHVLMRVFHKWQLTSLN